MERQISRRKALGSITATVTAVALAGCSASAGADDGEGGGGSGGGGTSGGGDGGDGGVPSEVSEYLADANGYDGVTDRTGDDAVTVSVGAGSNGVAFDPAAVRVSAGTTVTWEWTGNGGGHNVVHRGGQFRSGDEFVSEAGHTYEYTFEKSGTYLYYCEPHRSVNMLGAVLVE